MMGEKRRCGQDWEAQDKKLDAEIAKDFYVD